MIVIEGLDNSGKSTLAKVIAHRLGYNIQESEGPPKSQEEINSRVERYNMMPRNTIFVRHPSISQPIYALCRETATEQVDELLVKEFISKRPLMIYCDPLRRGLSGHVEKDGIDRADHVSAIGKHYDKLLLAYRKWAIKNALIVYRIGDPMDRVVKLCLIDG